MNFYFAFDEYTDVANKTDASKIAHDAMDAIRRRDAIVQSSHGKITTMAQEWVIILNLYRKGCSF